MEVAKIDLRGLNPSSPGWGKACAAVTASMVAHGCVVVVHDAISPELRQAVFDRAMPQLFAFPVETKQQNVSSVTALKGYISKVPGADFESFNVNKVDEARSFHDFSNIFWPQGNPEFSNTIGALARKVIELEDMVEKMTLVGLGVREENIASHLHALTHVLRLSHYCVPEDAKMGVTLPAHTDPSLITALVQHEVEGLEVQTKDGRWIAIPPEADTITFMAGDLLTLITNGRVAASVHRVKTLSNRERYAILCASSVKNSVAISVMDEFVDHGNPPKYNSVKTDEYLEFRYSGEGFKSSQPLEEYCGVHKCGSTE
ncbi:unnamed protein product [Urochloa decumbens]|uniref:2-oxoglutarate-dependent dioxygenase DAO n=1 Tax=Urochloa decumbens TaxID=240449 RepID=A0ABC9GPL8_9POAL